MGLRRSVLLLLIGVVFVVSCSDTQRNAQTNARQAQADVQATATPTSRPTVNPDQAAGLVSRFYRDLGNKNVHDIESIASDDFLRNHRGDWFADYGWIQDPRLQIKSVNDRTVSYLVDYTYSTTKGKLFWERTGAWTLNHGSSSGWVLDNDTWDSIHLIGLSVNPNGTMIPVQDAVYSDGRHEFDFMGERFSFLANKETWHITPVGPASGSQTQAPSTTVTVNANGSTQTYSGTGTTHIYIPPATSSGSDCEEASLQWKSEDGDWIGTDDGRKFHIMAGDEPEVLTWTETDDLKICGDTIIDVDDGGSEVEVY